VEENGILVRSLKKSKAKSIPTLNSEDKEKEQIDAN
jgi:hypothetical protein